MSKIIIHMSDGPDGPYVARVAGCNKSHAALISQQAQERAAYDVLKTGDMIATTAAVFAGHYPPVEVRGRLVK